MIISDIPIHKEQNPDQTSYFNTKDREEIVKILEEGWYDNSLCAAK